MVIRERAPAKINLVLRVGETQQNGLHEVCSLFASLELADLVEVEAASEDSVSCEGVEGPNLVTAAVDAFRRFRPVPPVAIRIDKRIPVAAGLAGGSADAAAVLRALDALASDPTFEWQVPFEHEGLVLFATALGSDVPSQVTPGHWVVTGTGAGLRKPQPLPPLAVVLVPSAEGLSTVEVFQEADRLGLPRAIEPQEADELARREWPDAQSVADALHNDLQEATLSLRPELGQALERLRATGALGAQVSGSGPTLFGLYPDRESADAAAAEFPGALVTMVASE